MLKPFRYRFILMDIRNFFGSKGSSKTAPKADSSSQSAGPVKKKRANVISDSESDEEVEKKPKVEAKRVTPKKEVEKSKSKLKEVNKSDFFNSNSKTSTSQPVKRKSPEKDSLKR